MKKKILAMIALCTAIMGLSACGNTETSTEVAGTQSVQEEVKGDSSSNEKTLSKNDATVEPTTAPTTIPTAKPTVTPTEAPVVPTKVEVSWEESGMSYELFENPDGTVAVIVTNNGDKTYSCRYNQNETKMVSFTLEPNSKNYVVLSDEENAKTYTTYLEKSTCKPQTNYLTTEIDCIITNENNGLFELKTSDIVKHFNNCINSNVTLSEFVDYQAAACLFTPGSGILIFYNDNNEIVTIKEPICADSYLDAETYVNTCEFDLPSDLEYSKITMVMQYTWADGIFE